MSYTFLNRFFAKPAYLLIVVVIIGAGLRLWNLGNAEFFHDEGFYAFRSIGYLDYVQNDAQTTPIQWFKDQPLPFWTHLSFHDHPPLFFIIQHIFFVLFGDSRLVARLPSALAGLFAIVLVYFIGQRVFKNKSAALFAALLLSASQIHIWISRSSLQESVLIFFVLLNLLAFFRFLENPKRWLTFGLTLGLCFLVKYTSFFLVPVYLGYLLFRNRALFLKKELYLAMIVTVVLFSPVIVYNFYLLKTVYHFDLQFAYLFHQATPEWQVSVGKVQEPFSNLIPNLIVAYSWPFLVLAIVGAVYALFLVVKKQNGAPLLWLLMLVATTLILIPVGSGFRFLAFYALPCVFLVTSLIVFLDGRFKKLQLVKIGAVIFVAFEVFSTLVRGIFLFPDFGITKLDQYLDQVFDGKASLSTPNSKNPHLQKIMQEYANLTTPGDKPVAIVYDENLSLPPRLWLFSRRTFYHGIPTFSVGQFKMIQKENGPTAFHGYELYFVKVAENGYLNPYFKTTDAADFEHFLATEFHLQPIKVISGYGNLPMFIVYKIDLAS